MRALSRIAARIAHVPAAAPVVPWLGPHILAAARILVLPRAGAPMLRGTPRVRDGDGDRC